MQKITIALFASSLSLLSCMPQIRSTSASPAQPSLQDLKPGMPYAQARQIILGSGWQVLYYTGTDDPSSEAQSLRDRKGYSETMSCFEGICRFEFAGSRRLIVEASGRDLTIKRWWNEDLQKQTSLPFVGTRRFNFLGGTGTGYTITIEQDGTTVIELHGTMQSEVLYRGQFREQMPLEGGGTITIKDNTAYSVVPITAADQQKCQQAAANGNPCMTKLY